MIPAILIILTIHIIIAIRWMLIKILSAVINDWERIKVIVPGGCYPYKNIIQKIMSKIKIYRMETITNERSACRFICRQILLSFGVLGSSLGFQFPSDSDFLYKHPKCADEHNSESNYNSVLTHAPRILIRIDEICICS